MRREDIPHLLRHFLARFCAEENRPITGISGEAMAHLSQLDWPGNIRQLENAVYRAVVMSDHDQLALADFPQSAAQSAAVPDAHQHTEPLIVGPAFHSTVPAMVSGTEIPIAPLPSAGTLAMLTSSGEMRPLEEMEGEIIRFAIAHYRGQMSEVARRLKIGRSTLYRKLDEAAADDPAAGGADETSVMARRIVATRCPHRNGRRRQPFGTFEPLPDGDRQTTKSVAKSAQSLQMGSLEVSLS